MNTGKTLAACFAVLFAVACAGRDDAGGGDEEAGLNAFDYEGFYLLDEVAIEGSLEPRDDVLTREGPRADLRGDIEFAPISAERGWLTGRLAVLDGGVIANGDLRVIDLEVFVEEGRWTVGERLGETFAVSLDGDHLRLEALPHFERNAGEPPRLNPAPSPADKTLLPSRLEATRSEPWGTEAVGKWNVLRMTFGDRETVTSRCLAEGSGSSTIDSTIEIHPSWMFEQVLTTNHFGDTECTAPTIAERSVRVGFVEERGRNLLLWTFDPEDPAGTAEASVFEMERDRGDDLTLSRIGCRFECPDGGPVRIVLTRSQTR